MLPGSPFHLYFKKPPKPQSDSLLSRRPPCRGCSAECGTHLWLEQLTATLTLLFM